MRRGPPKNSCESSHRCSSERGEPRVITMPQGIELQRCLLMECRSIRGHEFAPIHISFSVADNQFEEARGNLVGYPEVLKNVANLRREQLAVAVRIYGHEGIPYVSVHGTAEHLLGPSAQQQGNLRQLSPSGTLASAPW